MDLIPRATQIAQAKMLFAQVGDELDTEAMWRLITRYTGLTELSELIRSSGEPITAAPGSRDRMPSANMGMPREYIRRNVSSGGNPTQGPGQQAMEMMLASGNGNEGAP